MVCCGSLSIISCEGENPCHQHTATPKHRPLCASGLTCLRLFAKPERQSWQDKDRKTVSALPHVATRGVLGGDFAGGHIANRAAPRGPRKGVTRGRLLVARWVESPMMRLFSLLTVLVQCATHTPPYAGTTCICRGTAAPGTQAASRSWDGLEVSDKCCGERSTGSPSSSMNAVLMLPLTC